MSEHSIASIIVNYFPKKEEPYRGTVSCTCGWSNSERDDWYQKCHNRLHQSFHDHVRQEREEIQRIPLNDTQRLMDILSHLTAEWKRYAKLKEQAMLVTEYADKLPRSDELLDIIEVIGGLTKIMEQKVE